MNEKRKEISVFVPICAIYFCTKCACNNFDFNEDCSAIEAVKFCITYCDSRQYIIDVSCNRSNRFNRFILECNVKLSVLGGNVTGKVASNCLFKNCQIKTTSK